MKTWPSFLLLGTFISKASGRSLVTQPGCSWMVYFKDKHVIYLFFAKDSQNTERFWCFLALLSVDPLGSTGLSLLKKVTYLWKVVKPRNGAHNSAFQIHIKQNKHMKVECSIWSCHPKHTKYIVTFTNEKRICTNVGATRDRNRYLCWQAICYRNFKKDWVVAM